MAGRKRSPIQHPVYFVSAVLRDAQERYPEIQKLLLGVLISSRKLRHYFEGHRITVVTAFPLERVLRNRSATGRVAEWSQELSGFDLHFANTKTIKSMLLADFLTEWTPTPEAREEPQSSLLGDEDHGRWIMYFDGSFSYEGAGAGVLIVSPTGEQLRYVVQMYFDSGSGKATNNTAEYEGLLAGLRAAAGLGIKQLVVRGDSQLVVKQVMKEYGSPQMGAYLDEVRKLEHASTASRWSMFPEARISSPTSYQKWQQSASRCLRESSSSGSRGLPSSLRWYLRPQLLQQRGPRGKHQPRERQPPGMPRHQPWECQPPETPRRQSPGRGEPPANLTS